MSDFVEKLNAMPLMTIYPTMRCNLKCDYCILKDYLLGAGDADNIGFLKLPLFLKTIKNCSPTHFLLSGGEPLMAEGLDEFINDYGSLGHRFSILTNLCFSTDRIKSFFNSFPKDYIGYLLISHHFQSGISIESVIERCLLLRNLGINHFINYVMIPYEFELIEGFTQKLQKNGINCILKPLYGEWSGREGRFPSAYTLEEDMRFLNMCTTLREAIELFDGVYATGTLCKGGAEHCTWSYWRYGTDGLVSPCCHGDGNPMPLEETSFVTGNTERKPCQLKYCAGALFAKSVSGMEEDYSGLPELIQGKVKPFGIDKIMDFIRSVQARGLRLVNKDKFLAIEEALKAKVKRMNGAGI